MIDPTVELHFVLGRSELFNLCHVHFEVHRNQRCQLSYYSFQIVQHFNRIALRLGENKNYDHVLSDFDLLT